MERVLTHRASTASLGPVCLTTMCLEAITVDDTLTAPHPTELGPIISVMTRPLMPE